MPEKSSATGIVLMHPLPEGRSQRWVDRATAVARSMPGFQALRMAVTDGGLQSAVAVTFDTAEQLHACLDCDAWAAALSEGNTDGVLRKSSDLLIVEGHRLPPGTAAFRYDVIDSATTEFVAAMTQLVTSTAKFSGYVGTVLLPPAPEAGIDEWTAILMFRADEQLGAWMASDERSRRLAQLRSQLRKDFDTLSVDAPFGSILRIDHGRASVTPRWKTAMAILLVLYPTVMLLSRFLGPVAAGLGRRAVADDVAESGRQRRDPHLCADAAGNEGVHPLAGSDRRCRCSGVGARSGGRPRRVRGDAVAIRHGRLAGLLAALTLRRARCSRPPTAEAARSARGTVR